MNEQKIEAETKMYLYDLMNAAKEHGFKGDDAWEFSMVSNTERIKIQKDFYPTISTQIVPEILLQVLHNVKTRLNQPFNDEQLPDKRSIINGELNFIVAHNPKRPRT